MMKLKKKDKRDRKPPPTDGPLGTTLKSILSNTKATKKTKVNSNVPEK